MIENLFELRLKDDLHCYMNDVSTTKYQVMSTEPLIKKHNELRHLYKIIIKTSNPQKFVGLKFVYLSRNTDYLNDLFEKQFEIISQLEKTSGCDIHITSLILNRMQIMKRLKSLCYLSEQIESLCCSYFDELESAY